MYNGTLVLDAHGTDTRDPRFRGVPKNHQIVFGTEAPGSETAVRPETGRTSDGLVPVLASS